MECKIFHSWSQKELQNEVNKWLKDHPVLPESMRFQFTSLDISSITSSGKDNFLLEHTLVLFFVPMVHI